MDSGRLIGDLWLLLLLYWLVSSIRGKKTAYRAGSPFWWVAGRIAVVVAIIAILHTPLARGALLANPAVRGAGVLLCAAGIALAIWARTTLGRNWSPVPSIKQEHELVITGAYRFVRHPIYTGMWFALFGSAMAGPPAWLAGLAFASVIFAFRVRREEGLMMRQFPAEYPAYMKRTKAVIPFVW
jgi:protein-S-isoprenylcysteine O-methyltransferase Ste14